MAYEKDMLVPVVKTKELLNRSFLTSLYYIQYLLGCGWVNRFLCLSYAANALPSTNLFHLTNNKRISLMQSISAAILIDIDGMSMSRCSAVVQSSTNASSWSHEKKLLCYDCNLSKGRWNKPDKSAEIPHSRANPKQNLSHNRGATRVADKAQKDCAILWIIERQTWRRAWRIQ